MNKFLLMSVLRNTAEEGADLGGSEGADLEWLLDDDDDSLNDSGLEEALSVATEEEGGDETPAEGAATEEPAVEETPAADPEADKAEPAEETPPAQEPEQTPEQPAAEAPEVEEEEPGSAEARISEWREKVKERFAISEEDSNMLFTDPQKVLPNMAASVYEAVLNDTLGIVKQMIPNVLRETQEFETRTNSLKDQFYSVNEDLKGYDEAEVANLIPQFAPIVLQNNPGISQEEVHRKVGMFVKTALGVKPVVAQPKPTAPPTPAPVVSPAAPTEKAPSNFLDMLIDSKE